VGSMVAWNLEPGGHSPRLVDVAAGDGRDLPNGAGPNSGDELIERNARRAEDAPPKSTIGHMNLRNKSSSRNSGRAESEVQVRCGWRPRRSAPRRGQSRRSCCWIAIAQPVGVELDDEL